MKTVLVMFLCLAGLAPPLVASAEQIGGGDLTFYPKNAPPVVYSHEKHVIEHALKCSACHYEIFQMAQGTYKMQMDKITKGEFCGKCHNGQRAFDVKDPNNCSRCHISRK